MIQHNWTRLLVVPCFVLCILAHGAFGLDNPYENITRLRWAGPPGSRPGSYEDFLNEHGLVTTPPLSISEVYRSARETLVKRILIVVEEGLYPSIETGLMGYVTGLEAKNYAVTIVLDTAFGGTAIELRSYARSVYNTEGLHGMLLIGDLPIAWHESTWDDGHYEQYPCDYFFMDLDGQWLDTDSNGRYDQHLDHRLPEIWVGRMTASPLSGSESSHINNLFGKIASHGAGDLSQTQRGLTFVDDDWSHWTTCGMDSIYAAEVTVVNDHQATVADTYQVELGEGYETIQVCAHSWPGGHAFSSRPSYCASYAHVYVESESFQICQLRIGAKDAFKVWMDGTEIITDTDGTLGLDDDHVPVVLSEGVHSFLVKVAQDKAQYGLAAHFTDAAGMPITGLTYHLEHPNGSDRHAPYITAWLTNGFHYWDNFWGALGHDFLGGESEIDAYEGLLSGGKTWQLWDIGSGYLDFATLYDDMDVGAVYAFTHVHCPSAQSATLWLGTYSGAKVWLNGEVVYYDNSFHGFEPDAQQVELGLQAGWNRLLIKVSVWYGANLSGRIGDSEKRELAGLAYDPAPTHPDYIHGWLMNGFYKNPDSETCLSEDYLNGEASVLPHEEDSSGSFVWRPGFGTGDWFDLEGYFSEDGGDVESSDIEAIDPDGLFYNLFACSAARYTESNYIAGRYTFADTYGLAIIGSTKSGSMLYFEDFYGELGSASCVGKAFQEWFTKQGENGFQNWEVCWYYGLTLIGDPTLFLNMRPAPAAIDDLAVALSGNDIRLSWSVPESEYGITHYVVYRCTSAGFFSDPLAETTNPTYVDMGATGNVNSNYFYIVKAVDGIGQVSNESNQVGEFDQDLLPQQSGPVHD